jgi:hypothetical protein
MKLGSIDVFFLNGVVYLFVYSMENIVQKQC